MRPVPIDSHRGATILIVDDQPANIGVLIELFERHDINVAVAQDGLEGLQRAEFIRPDLILLDVMMPGLDGFETCRRLKNSESTQDIPVIFMTALADVNSCIEGFAAGAVDYIAKPFELREVLARVNTHLTLRSREQLRALAAHREAAREEERKHIALEVHDELGQLLTALKMQLGLLREQVSGHAGALEKVDDLHALARQAIFVVRDVASRLRPAALSLGILPALEWLAADFNRRHAIACTLDLRCGDIRLDEAQTTGLFRIAQESLTNVLRHAQATRVAVSLLRTEAGLGLTIRDDGRGFKPQEIAPGASYGLLGMRERAQSMGGTLVLDSSPGKGTTINIQLPCTVQRHDPSPDCR